MDSKKIRKIAREFADQIVADLESYCPRTKRAVDNLIIPHLHVDIRPLLPFAFKMMMRTGFLVGVLWSKGYELEKIKKWMQQETIDATAQIELPPNMKG